MIQLSSHPRLRRLLASPLWRKLKPLLPWLSLSYGIFSGWAIERDFVKSPRLLLMGIGSVICIIVLAQLERLQRRLNDTAVKPWQQHLPRLLFAGNWLTQICVQYVCLFVVPLTFFSRAYGHLAAALFCAALALSEVLWRRAMRWPFSLPLIRAATGYFALAFSLPVLAPQLLPHFQTIVDVAVILLFIPWSRLEKWWDLAWKRRLLWLFLVSIPLANLVLSFLPQPRLLSIWVEDLRFGFDIQDHALVSTIDTEFSRTLLQQQLDAGHRLCCHTPIMGPLGSDPPIVHSWYADGELIDRIDLGHIKGRNSIQEKGFRTYSCKQAFPSLAKIKRLECRVLLGRGATLDRKTLQLAP